MTIEALMQGLAECEKFFDNRMDADHDGVKFIPNTAMKIAVKIGDLREDLSDYFGIPLIQNSDENTKTIVKTNP